MRLTFLASVACLLAVGSVRAQEASQTVTGPAPLEAPPPPPPSEAAAPVRGAPPPPAACEPSCRPGFACVSGSCVSSCNPSCGAGDVCTATGECVAGAAKSERQPDTSDLPGATGVHRHDGFFLRLTVGLGGGFLGFDAPGDSNDVLFSGGGYASSLDIGGALSDRFVLFARLRECSLIDPAVYVDDNKVGDANASSFTQGMLGIGFSYFIMPINMYLGAAIGFAALSGRYRRPGRNELKYTSDVGVGFDAEIGKEWWVADDWGIGLALRLSVAGVKATETIVKDADYAAAFVSMLFSATYQ